MGYPTFRLPVGPQHPALKEPEYFQFEVDGEYVVDVKPRIGYIHRGIEKAAETRTFIQDLYLIERICGLCSHVHTTCYTQAVEELLNVEIPPRARFIRTIVAELERIHSHSLWIGLAAHEIGFDTLFMYTWRDREIVMDLLELISGKRIHHSMNTLGGVVRDITPETSNKIQKHLHFFHKRIAYYKTIGETERTILKRTAEIGILRPEDALTLCAVGPTLRASGIKQDVRADDPYIAYGEIPFEVVTYPGCDVLSRLLVRFDEIFESIRIITHSLDHLPSGEVRVKVPRSVPEGEAVGRAEAPRGEVFHYVKSNGTSKPERCKVRSPTLANIPAVCKMLVGGYIADIPIVLAGIDPCFACADRMVFVDIDEETRWVWSDQELRRYATKWHQRK